MKFNIYEVSAEKFIFNLNNHSAKRRNRDWLSVSQGKLSPRLTVRMIYTFACGNGWQGEGRMLGGAGLYLSARQPLQNHGASKIKIAAKCWNKGAHLLLAEAIHLFNVSCILLSTEAEQNLRQCQTAATITTTTTTGTTTATSREAAKSAEMFRMYF